MTYTKWLRSILVVGVFASLLIPFIIANGALFPNMFFPFITGKNFTFRILVEILFGLYVLLALRDPNYRPRFSWVLVAVAAFTLWGLVAVIFSVDPDKSFWSNFERMEGYITVLHLFAYFLVAAAVLNAEKLWTWYFRLSVLASVIMSFYGILQLTGHIAIDQGGARLDGTLGNAIYLAVYMLFNIFFALILMHREWKNFSLRWVYGAIAILDAVMLLFSETRGTMLGLAGGIFVAGIYFWFASAREPVLHRARTWTLAGLVVCVILAGGFLALRHEPFIQKIPGIDRLATTSLSNPETTTRLVIWGMAWQGFLEHPITGWGQENFSFVFNKFYQPQLYGQESWFDRAHNAYLDWLINGGAPGFLLFISLFATSLWAVARARERSTIERALLFGLIVGFGIHEIFVFDNIVSYLQFFAILALAHGLSERPMPRSITFSRPLSENGMAVAAPIVAIVTIGLAWYLNAPGIASAQDLIKALTPDQQTGQPDPSTSLVYFKQALAKGPLGQQEVTEQLLQAAVAIAQSSSPDPTVVQDYYTTAETAIENLTKIRPHDARLELFWGSFLASFGQSAQAEQELKAALADSPDKQQIMFELALDVYAQEGDYKDAAATLKQAYELDTKDDDARVYYAAALFDEAGGATSTADQLLDERYGTTTVDNDVLLSAYYTTKQYGRAEAILDARIQKDKTDAQSWVELAGIEYQAGQKDAAIATLKAAEEADPADASQIDQLIQEVQSGQVSG
ncbi:MAG: O-antigen ligase family protein [Minisyncoccia bacterium]